MNNLSSNYVLIYPMQWSKMSLILYTNNRKFHSSWFKLTENWLAQMCREVMWLFHWSIPWLQLELPLGCVLGATVGLNSDRKIEKEQDCKCFQRVSKNSLRKFSFTSLCTHLHHFFSFLFLLAIHCKLCRERQISFYPI